MYAPHPQVSSPSKDRRWNPSERILMTEPDNHQSARTPTGTQTDPSVAVELIRDLDLSEAIDHEVRGGASAGAAGGATRPGPSH